MGTLLLIFDYSSCIFTMTTPDTHELSVSQIHDRDLARILVLNGPEK